MYLTNHQLHAEYSQLTRNWKLSAIADLDISAVGWLQNDEFSEDSVVRKPAVFRLLTEVTIMIRFARQASRTSTSPTNIPWEAHIDPLLFALTVQAPRLEIMRLVFYQYQSGALSHRFLADQEFYDDFDTENADRFFEPFPPLLRLADMDMALVKSGEGFKVGFSHVERPQRRDGAGGGGVWRAGDEKEIYHRVTRLGASLYRRSFGDGSKGEGAGKQEEEMILVTNEVVKAPKMAKKYPEEVLGLMEGWERSFARQFEAKMKEWIDDAWRRM